MQRYPAIYLPGTLTAESSFTKAYADKYNWLTDFCKAEVSYPEP